MEEAVNTWPNAPKAGKRCICQLSQQNGVLESQIEQKFHSFLSDKDFAMSMSRMYCRLKFSVTSGTISLGPLWLLVTRIRLPR